MLKTEYTFTFGVFSGKTSANRLLENFDFCDYEVNVTDLSRHSENDKEKNDNKVLLTFKKRYDDFEKGLSEYVWLLDCNRDRITEVKKKNEIVTRCFIQSDYAQIGFCVSKEAMRIISDMNCRLDFSILSWGMADP